MNRKLLQKCNRSGLALLLLLLLAQWGFAQTRDVSGVVKDQSGMGMPGVNVLVKGTTRGTVTDTNGNYRIEVAGGEVLVYSFIGYAAQEIPVGNLSSINIILMEDVSSLQEVVVIGYGEVNKRDVTGAIGSVNTKELLQAVPTNISQGLQGRVAGVLVSKSDGAPGAGVSLQIRGANTFLGSAEPLYVIDGIPYVAPSSTGSPSGVGGDNQTNNPLSFLNPQDIESIEVLKDASATAVYGARAANGVVLITTRRGSEGTDNLEFTVNYGISDVSKRIKLMDAYTYAKMRNEAYTNKSIFEGTPLDILPFPGTTTIDPATGQEVRNPSPEDFLNGYNGGGTNWQDQIFQRAASADYTLTMSGGNNKGGYTVSGNVLDQKGVIVNSAFKRFSIRGNIYRNVTDWLTLGSNNNITRSKNDFVRTNSDGGSGSSLTGAIRTAMVYPPTLAVVDPAGLSESELAQMNNQIGWYASSPWYYVRHAVNSLTTTQLFSSSFAEFKFLKNFKFRQNFGFNYTYNVRDVYYDRFTQEGKEPVNGIGAVVDNTFLGLTHESILSYDKKIGNHNVSGVAAFTAEQYDFRNTSITGKQFPNDVLQNNELSTGVARPVVENGLGQRRNVGFLGRANYSYQGKYLATVSFRRDGTTVFPKNKWGTFYAFNLGWRISDEAFVQQLNVFDDLKLRVGYGETGNQSIGAYQAQTVLSPSNTVVNGSLVNGFAEPEWAGPANPNLKWETTRQWNIGLDAMILKNRLSFTFDVYRKFTTDLLQRVAIPRSTGFGNQLVNFGNVTNHGLEITVNGKVFEPNKRLQWNVNANISFNRNEIGGLPDDQFASRLFHGVDNVFLQRNGQPIGTIYGWREDGFYDNIAEVVADPAYASQSDAAIREKVGEIKYKNYDNDRTSISATDRVIIGDTNPDYIFGITNTFEYKGFNLSVFVQGVMGNDIVNANLLEFWNGGIGNAPQSLYDTRWTSENPSAAKWPKALETQRRNYLFSDRYVEDGSYVRLKNVNLGYTFQKPFKFMRSLNVYTSASNLLTWTRYSWYDPDVNAFGGDASRRGVDMNSYPNSRTYTVGFRAVF